MHGRTDGWINRGGANEGGLRFEGYVFKEKGELEKTGRRKEMSKQ